MIPNALSNPTMKPACALAIVIFSLQTAATAADPAFTIEKTPSGGAIIKHNGKLFAEYVVDQANKPYLAPVIGPTGKQMTRNYPMKKVEGEQHDHPHHRGINFGHESISGFDSWAETATFEEMKANPEDRELEFLCDYCGSKYLIEV